MLIGARTAAWRGGEPLPYDVELEYLESKIGQFINTGVIGNADMVINAKIGIVDISGFGADTISYYGANTAYYNGIQGCSDSVVGGLRFVNGRGGENRSFIYPSVGDIVESCSTSNGYSFKINGTEYHSKTFSGSLTYSNLPIYLFGVNRSGTYQTATGGRMRIYKFDISGVIDLIPVLKNDVPCMYDKIEGNFFYNQGTGVFGYKKKDGTIVEPT